MGVCNFWYGENIDKLRDSKPTKISVSPTDGVLLKNKGVVPTIFAAKLQVIAKPACGHLFTAYGSLIKPSFEKILVQPGSDIKLKSTPDGILLPISQTYKSKKGSDLQNQSKLAQTTKKGNCYQQSNQQQFNHKLSRLLSLSEIEGVVFDDVPEAVEKWHSLGIKFRNVWQQHFAANTSKKCVAATERKVNVEAGSTVAIFGLGAIGMAVSEGARLRGAKRIIGVDLNEDKFEIGKKFGVTDFINSRICGDKTVSQVIIEMTDGGADYCFECVDMASLVHESYASCQRDADVEDEHDEDSGDSNEDGDS